MFYVLVSGAEIAAFVIALILGAAGAILASRLLASKTLGSARKEADELLRRARIEGETLQKQLELDARSELAQRREDFEKETDDARTELREMERRVAKREDNLDRKLDALTTKEKYLDELDEKVKARETALEGKQEELDGLVEQHRKIVSEAREEQKQRLLQIANLSEDDARKEAIRIVEEQSQHEAGQVIQRAMQRAEEEVREHSLKITLQAIQRYASEHTADSTVSAIAIASDDMKGRVIGREGRNIRAFEKATGVDVIVDDTPGVVVVSCFDPVRRAIAAESLQKLLDDGRIHPSRIEEIVEQMTKEIQERIVKYGKDACIEANVQGVHPKISEMMGRLYYRMSYGQNILRHSIEVGYLCQVIADELGLDGDLARRCGFLHDVGKAMDHEVEGGHPAIGMDYCKKFSEKEEVLNAIGGHHNDIASTTPYTPIVMAADAVSGARPGARRESMELYIKRLEHLEGIALDQPNVTEAHAIQAGREVRVIVDAKKADDAEAYTIAKNIAKRVEDEMTFPGEIKVTVLREVRAEATAR